ncbi:MAG: cob(I)yrinic acid a,c-diamide adenosyltransferase [Candidatus Eremiobacteraeota bacterium]|nr:cob(I)yrinic acid a,c-diamide adenosyltransferase [Candidatus Eremiobacteraeota bacterium]
MSKAARIYTRGGDGGTTGLIGGARVRKSAARIEAYGNVDELSSAIGVARNALTESSSGGTEHSHDVAARLDAWLAWTQDVLFNVGGELASPSPAETRSVPSVHSTDTAALERAIDAVQVELPPLNQFIHPGGGVPGASLHVARTVARRAERAIVALAENDPVDPEILRYMNRLSDALFVWARWINHAYNRAEHPWNQQSQAPP